MNPEPPAPRSSVWIPLGAAIFAALLAVPTILYPHGRDQGNYAYAGWEVLLGSAPYRDVFVFKPPGSVLVHALSIALFGVTPVAIRAFDLLWLAATAAVIAVLTRRIAGDVAGVVAGAACAVMYVSVDYWNIAQTDGWMNLPCGLALIAVGSVERAPPGLKRAMILLMAGMFVALAVMFKYTAVGVLLPVALILLVQPISLPEFARRLLGVGAGLIVGTGLWVAWIWGTGAWEAFLDSQFDLVPRYVAETARARSWWAAAGRLFGLGGAWYDVIPLMYGGVVGALGAAAVAAFGDRAGRVGVIALWAWWLIGFASIISQNKYFDYHFLALWGPASALVGVAVAGFARWIRGVAARAGRPMLQRAAHAAPALICAALILGTPVRERWMEGAPVLVGRTPIEQFWTSQREFRYKDWSVDDQRLLTAHLRESTAPEDRVFVWGFEPAVNVWARRRTVSRFLYNYPFRVDFSNPSYEDELLTALRARPPEVFVVVIGDATYGVTGNMLDSQALLRRRPALSTFLEQFYDSPVSIRRYRVHRLRRGAP